jgi:3-hydroxyisobutyrate dehydrogenase
MPAAEAGQSSDPHVAVIGTGIMGSAMARNLDAGDLAMTVWDRSAAATERLATAGLRVAASAPEAVRGAAAVESVVFGGCVAEAFAGGAVWAQMGTIGAEPTTRFSQRLGQLRPDVLYVDAPVSGSKGPADAGQLLILASGPPRPSRSCARCSGPSAARRSGWERPARAAT